MQTRTSELRKEIIFGFLVVNLVVACFSYLFVAMGVFSSGDAAYFFGGSFIYQVGYTVAELRYRN